MGNIETIEVGYLRTKEYIVYDGFQTIMVAIVLFFVFSKFFEEWQKNIAENQRLNFSKYWGQVRIYVFVLIASSLLGPIFSLVESLCADMQTALINSMGGDSSSKATESMERLVYMMKQEIEMEQLKNGLLDFSLDPMDYIFQGLASIVAAIGTFLFKYTYTFFIIGRYMWLLMLELVAPIAIVLCLNSSTRSYFYTWTKNMVICYLLIPMFLMADIFSNHVANVFLEGYGGQGTVVLLMLICCGVWIKIKMFSTVRNKATQLF